MLPNYRLGRAPRLNQMARNHHRASTRRLTRLATSCEVRVGVDRDALSLFSREVSEHQLNSLGAYEVPGLMSLRVGAAIARLSSLTAYWMSDLS